jgi:zinc protease
MFETSSTFTPTYTSFDMTSLDLVTLDTYFDRTFPVFADAFLHPAWDQEEFPRVIKELTLSAQQSENNPFTLSDDLLHESFFAGHPYEASWQGAGYSLEAITLDDVKAYFAQKVSPARLFLVAVGNFDEGKLLSQLNATFGTMPRGSYQRPPVPSFENSVKPGLLVQTYEQSAGLAYMEACFAMPSPESGDYPAALVAFNVLDDLLFEIVRGQNGACYSIWTSLFGGSASFGEISVYRTPVPGKIKRLVDDAIAVLVSGHGTAGGVASTEPGEKAQPAARPVEDFVALGDVLPFYKTKLLTQFYTGQQTNTAIAAQIASSVVYHGDYRDYLLTLSRVQSVTAEDVVRVVRKYLVQAPALWIALGDPALLKDMSQGDFQSFTGKVAAAPFVSR